MALSKLENLYRQVILDHTNHPHNKGLLDEATSHLDIIKEKEINDMIKLLNITRIIIAHRPETISSVDRIIVLNNGRIVSDQML